ncbi:MAG: hypothetical protein EPN62_00965 [Candidimonas sp.]|nr:MAG: hypothetical protein EPN77_01965 [Candidimonas sp.]TAM26897.1 MAG: hypothetical protein EPN62_00965 [Candidimonas sp.]
MAQGSPSIDFLYDFLYVDKPRVSSWFAQMFDEGVLTTFKSTSNTTIQASGEASVGIPLTAKGSLQGSGSATKGNERNYNAEWSLPLTLLDALDENGYIHRSIGAAEIGSLVLVSGNVQLTDITMLQKIWSPAIKIMSANMKVTHQNKGDVAKFKELLATFGEIINAMPPESQLYIKDNSGETVWASLKEDHMIVNASTLALTHGARVQGTWHILAALDAKPDVEVEESVVEALNTGDLGDVMINVLDMVRKIVGRSHDAYAITPILIFRKTIPTT